MSIEQTNVAGAVASGAAAALLSAVGIEPAPLFWSLVGASLGMSFAATATRTRAAAVFVAVTLCCSLFGAWIAQRWFGGEAISRNAFACALAIIFHPALNAAVTRIPVFIDGALRKLGLGGPGGQP